MNANAHGGGEIIVSAHLDQAAVAQLGGQTPEKRLALGDLTEAGWSIEGPAKLPDGGLEISATHLYSDVAEGERLLADVAGVDGPLEGIELRQRRTFTKTTTSFRATVDLKSGLGRFTDPDLRAAVAGPNGEPLGVSDTQLATRFGAPVDQLFGLVIATGLPGTVTSNAPKAEGTRVEWKVPLGQTVTLEASSEQTNVRNIAAAVVASLAGVGLVGLAILRLPARSRRATPVLFDQDLEGQ